jgi:hypothetical protein
MTEDTTLSVSCHCGLSTYTFNVPTSSLPIKQNLYHCNIFRRISGCLCTSYLKVPLSNPPPNLSTLTAYKSSDILTSHFCSTCSTHLYLEYNHDGHYEVSHGSVLGNTEGILNFVGHMCVDDTRDGGASTWMPMLSSRVAEKCPAHVRGDCIPSKESSMPSVTSVIERRCEGLPNRTELHRIQAHCHCGGVSFSCARPSEEALTARSPYPDLLVPYHSGASAKNPDNLPWWVSKDKTKWLAGSCSCDSCRRIAGFDVVQWAFIPLSSIFFNDGERFTRPFVNRFPTIKSYRSSSGVTRWFCDGCGANIFWDGDERPSLLDVAVGLFDAESGARAEEWLEWVTDRVSFRENAHSEQYVVSLEDGLRGWKQIS